jgi:hypothetical protein
VGDIISLLLRDFVSPETRKLEKRLSCPADEGLCGSASKKGGLWAVPD